MAERESRRRRALRAIDEIGDSLETSITPWLVMTSVVFVPLLIWLLLEAIFSDWSLPN